MKEKIFTKQHLIAWVAVTVVLAGGAFYAGSVHAKNAMRVAMTAGRGQFPAGMGGARTGTARFGMGGGAVMGSVLSKDDTSMTVKMRDGSSKIVLYSGTTQVSKFAAGSAADVSVGTEVTVVGTQNPDGSVAAQSIQIRPATPMQPMAQPAR